MDFTQYTTEIYAGVNIAPNTRSNPLDNPNFDFSDSDAWDQVLGGSYRAETGETMNAGRAFTIGAVWQAINLISGDIAKIPLMLYTEAASGVRREVKRHPLIDLVQARPNEDENAFKFWRRAMVHALVWNNAYIWAPYDRSNGQIKEMYHFLPDRTAMRRIEGNLWCVTEINGSKEYFDASEVIHIEGISWDCVEGIDLVSAARNSWALALAQEKFASKFFKHGGRIGGILELPIGMSKPAKDTVEEGFRKKYENTDSPFSTVILRDNAKFHAAQQTPKDSQLIEGTEQQVRQVARWFNLAPSKLGLSDSVSYNSKTEDNQAYLDTTLSHWLKPIAMECTLKLLSNEQRRTMWLEHDTSELLRMDPLKRSQYYNTMIAATVINPNEARRMENMEPYSGGEKYQNPNTSKGLTPDKPAGDGPTANPPQRSHSLARIVFHIGSNARHKAKKPASFLEWIDGNLATHRHECKEIGQDDSIVDAMLGDFKRVAEYANGDELRSEIDKIVTIYEKGIL